MKLSEKVILAQYRKYDQKDPVQISFKIDRPRVYEFKRYAQKKGLFYSDIIDQAMKQFIEEEKGVRS